MFDISNEVAVVTGAAHGNGKAIAVGLAQAGAKVVCCDIDVGAVEKVAELIESEGGAALAIGLDVASRQNCRAAAEQVLSALGATSILVNNAGILRRTPPDSRTFDEDWNAVMAVNLGGTINMIGAFLPQLRQTRGRIVNMASIMSVVAAPTMSAYAASKGAIVQMTKALANDLADDGIRANAIAPGVIETAMTASTRANPEALARFMAHTPLHRPGRPEELVGAVIFLASGASSYVTGALIPVDGGYLSA